MSKDNFQWTDELVVEFTSWSLSQSPTYQGRYADIEQFKQSHSPKEQPPQRIGVKIKVTQCDGIGFNYSFWVSTYLADGKLPLIKNAIEQILNDDNRIISIGAGLYNQKQVDELCEKAFNAAVNLCVTVVKNNKYPTFQDYKNSIKP